MASVISQSKPCISLSSKARVQAGTVIDSNFCLSYLHDLKRCSPCAGKSTHAALSIPSQVWQRVHVSRDRTVATTAVSETGSYGVFTLNYDADKVC